MNLNELADRATMQVERGRENVAGLDWFVVGGAVRDTLRGVEPHDLDFVVVGESEQSMKRRGFRLVDSDNNETFPVFLNGDGDEFALARRDVPDSSSDNPHQSFDFETGNVPLREDLERRDLTVNAMALSPDGELIDPHGGRDDVKDGIIRHVSEAFADDALRVLRAARFAARLDAEIAPETRELMGAVAPDLLDLPEERRRMELEKALVQGNPPSIFFKELANTPVGNTMNALSVAFHTIDMMQHVPAGPEEHHQEGSVFEHTMLVLNEMNKLRPNDELALLMALFHDVGKLATKRDDWPQHHGHGKAGVPIIDRQADKFAFSNDQRRAAKDAARHHMRLKEIEEMRSATVFDLVGRVAFDERLVDLVVADSRGKRPPSSFPKELADARIEAAKQARLRVGGEDLIAEGIDPEDIGGERFGKRLRDRRISAMKEIEREFA